jgi:hypothetical protein
MSASANFAATPRSAGKSFVGPSAAPSDLFTPGANGSRVDSVGVTVSGTAVAGSYEIYDHDGATAFLLKTGLITAAVPSATVQNFSAIIPLGIVIPTGHKLQVSATFGANTIHFVAQGGDF